MKSERATPDYQNK